MVNPWFCKIEGEEMGPVSGSTLREMVDQGKVTPETHIRRGDSTRWVKAGQVQGLFTQAGATAKSASASSSQMNLKRARSLDTPPKPPVPPPVAGPPPPVEGTAVQSTSPADAAPPPPRDSQAIPTGVPIGTAGGNPSVPMGKAVAPAGTTATASHDDDHFDPYEARRQKKKQQQLIVFIGMGVAGLLIVGGGLAYALMGGGDAAEVAEKPVDSEAEVPAAEPEQPPTAAETEAQQQAEAVQQLLSAVDQKSWREISTRLGLKGIFKLKVTEVWLSDDPRGQNVLAPKLVLDPSSAPATEAVASQQEPEEAAASEKDPDELANLLAKSNQSSDTNITEATDDEVAAVATRYLIIGLEVTNSGETTLAYESWNPVSGEETAASLIANEKTELQALTSKEAAGPGRLGRQEIPPGETVIDHLVFAAPTQPVRSLKLLIPKAAVGHEGMYGFLITPEVLAARYELQLAEAQNSETPTGADSNEPLPGEAAAPPTAVAAEEPAEEEPKPLTEAERLQQEFKALTNDITESKETSEEKE